MANANSAVTAPLGRRRFNGSRIGRSQFARGVDRVERTRRATPDPNIITAILTDQHACFLIVPAGQHEQPLGEPREPADKAFANGPDVGVVSRGFRLRLTDQEPRPMGRHSPRAWIRPHLCGDAPSVSSRFARKTPEEAPPAGSRNRARQGVAARRWRPPTSASSQPRSSWPPTGPAPVRQSIAA